jgi:glyoxylase-like metal-dependent hydrolase (beta-lactamase superfamily II)
VRILQIEKFTIGPLSTNCYLVHDESNAIIIDVGGDPAPLIDFLENKKLRPKLILATHGHFDHILGISALKKKYSIPFMVHHKELELIKNFKEIVRNFVSMYNLSIGISDIETPKPDDTFEDGHIITIGNISLKVLETPGHTLGSSCFLSDNALFSGDTLFMGSIGRTDYGGDEELMKMSLKKLRELPDDLIVYPGHGPITTLGHEKSTNPFLINPDYYL